MFALGFQGIDITNSSIPKHFDLKIFQFKV
jgi:hypothetical protein